MDCENFEKNLDSFEDLTDDEIAEMNIHASECERCAKEMDFMRSVRETLKSLPEIEVPADFMASLNARLDAEERRIGLVSRVALGARRNWKQYTAAAACLALVAVITANGKLLTDRMSGDGGEVINDIPVTDNTIPSVSPAVVAEVTESVTKDNAETEKPIQKVAEISQTPERTVNDTVTVSSKPQKRAAKIQSSEQIVHAENETIQNKQPTADDDLQAGIQTASAEGNENQIAVLSMEPAESDMSRNARNMPEAYTVSGKPVMELAAYDSEEGGQIGRLKIPPKDETDAMDVIMKYSYEVDGDYYVTSPDKMVNIFCDLVDRGVNYSDYIPDYEGTIKFQLVIG